MNTILIQPANDAEMKLVEDFLKRSKLRSRFLSDEDLEDVVLGKLMEETDYNDVIDTEDFLKNLRS